MLTWSVQRLRLFLILKGYLLRCKRRPLTIRKVTFCSVKGGISEWKKACFRAKIMFFIQPECRFTVAERRFPVFWFPVFLVFAGIFWSDILSLSGLFDLHCGCMMRGACLHNGRTGPWQEPLALNAEGMFLCCFISKNKVYVSKNKVLVVLILCIFAPLIINRTLWKVYSTDVLPWNRR